MYPYVMATGGIMFRFCMACLAVKFNNSRKHICDGISNTVIDIRERIPMDKYNLLLYLALESWVGK